MTTLSTLGANTQVALKEGTSWSDVVRAAMLDANADALPTAKTPVAKPVSLTDQEKAALTAFADQLGTAVWPSTRRQLTKPELRKLVELLATTKDIGKLVDRVEKAEKTALFNHFDVCAEKVEDNPANPALSPRHKDGFYIREDTENGSVPDLPVKVTREVKSASVALSAEKLLELVIAGEISRETYLSLTKQVRVIDEDAVMREIKRDPGLISVLKAATVVTKAATASMNLRKND